MDKRKIFLLAGALLIAVATALLARNMFAGGGAPEAEATVMPAEPQGPMVVVAKTTLDTGTIIQPDSLALQPWPKDLVKDVYFIQSDDEAVDLAALSGRVVRHSITAGEPVTQGALVAPGDRGFLAAALGPGMRAVTIPVTRPTGVGGFVFPGDRVDLMLTQRIEGNEGPSLKTTETVLKNLRVLATNQSTQARKDEDGNVRATDISMVTLEATPRIAEKITVAQSIGTISLSLRSLADNRDDVDALLASGAVDLPEGLTPAEERAWLAKRVGSGAEVGSTYVTGGDVSRFQRTTIPPQSEGQTTTPDGKPASTGPTVRVRRGGQVETYEF